MTNAKFESNRHRILRVQLYIDDHLDEELSLDRLADIAHLSPYHFHRIFRATVGEGVAEYVRRIRLESAAIALKSTTDPVTKLAFDAGYGSHEAFTRAFRRRFGVSPTDFRNNHISNSKPTESDMTSKTKDRVIRIETMPAMRAAYLRHVGPYKECAPMFEKMMGWAFKKGLFGPETKVLSICHDDPDVTPPEKTRLDCCVTVDESFVPEGEIEVQTIPEGEYAILTHRGSYDGLADSYRWLFGEWLSTSGRECANQPPIEIYLNNPSDTNENELLTDICVALRAA